MIVKLRVLNIFIGQGGCCATKSDKRLSCTSKLDCLATDKLKITTGFQISHSKLNTLSD